MRFLPSGGFRRAVPASDLPQFGIILFLAVTGLGGANAIASPSYLFTRIDRAKPATYSPVVAGINAFGEVVGQTDFAQKTDAFRYFNGRVTDLGGLQSDSRSYSFAYAINDAGQIVGDSFSPSGTHAFFWSGGSMFDLGTFQPSDQSSHAYAVNRFGQIVGGSSTHFYDPGSATYLYQYHAFSLNSPGQPMVDLGTLGGESSEARGINSAGEIVGFSSTAAGVVRAFLYRGGAMSDLGTLGGPASAAYAINDSGLIAGTSDVAAAATPHHAFLGTPGALRDLGTLGGFNSTAFAINPRGDVVGTSDVKHSTEAHAFLYARGKMIDLNDYLPATIKEFVLTSAVGINALGQITGNAWSRTEGTVAWLLTPVPTLTVTTAKNITTSRARIVIRGKAGPSVRAVSFRINNHRSHAVAGFSKWHFDARLRPGRNFITIRALGGDNHTVSKIVTAIRS